MVLLLQLQFCPSIAATHHSLHSSHCLSEPLPPCLLTSSRTSPSEGFQGDCYGQAPEAPPGPSRGPFHPQSGSIPSLTRCLGLRAGSTSPFLLCFSRLWLLCPSGCLLLPLPLCLLTGSRNSPAEGFQVGCYEQALVVPPGPSRDPFHPTARSPFQRPLQGLRVGHCFVFLLLRPLGPPPPGQWPLPS